MSTLIQLNNLCISAAGKQILNIEELCIAQHKCILLTGANGSGKTTLLKVLSGLLRPDNVDIEYQGLNLSWTQAKNLLIRDMIYMHQQPYLFDTTVINNITYGLKRRGESAAIAQEKALDALDWAQLPPLAHRNAQQLSGGEKQRIALTRARVLSPRMLLLDEPTASMDIEAKRQTTELLERLKNEGVTIILSSHEAHTINQFADQHLVINHGNITPYAPPSDDENITMLTPNRNSASNL